MLSSPQHQHSLHVSLSPHLRFHHNPNSTTVLHFPTTATRYLLRFIVSSSSHNHHHNKTLQNPEKPIDNNTQIFRKHNDKSTDLLIRHLSTPQRQSNPKIERFGVEDNYSPSLSDEDRLKLLELSLVRKKTPQFPGSIFIEPSNDAVLGSPPIQSLFDGGEDKEMLVKALEIRRGVTVEIFKEEMRKGKFGITYYSNLVSLLPDFIDYIMIKAASMKQLPEYSQSTYNVRAKTFIDESNVVPLIRWLKHNSLSYPQIAKLLCMSRGNLEAIRDIAEWLKSIRVKGRFIGVAFMKAGDKILNQSVEELDEIVSYLENNGVRRDWMGYVISRCPQLLAYNMKELKSRVAFYVNMGMNDKDFGTMVFDYPQVLGYFSMEEMNQKVAYLMEFGLSHEDVGRLLAFKPQLMGCSIEERWKPLIKYLYYLGISKDGMRRILTIKPMVFCIDLESTIVPKVQFLRDIGVREDAIGNMLVKFPPLLTYSLYKKIRPVVIFLLTKAGVTQRDIGKVIGLGPELLGCSIAHKLDVNVKYFLSLGIPLPVLGEMIADFPMLLRYNIDVLRPKYRYLRRIMVRPLQDLIEFPRFFSYSLEGRIVPRHKILLDNRINLKLRYMLVGTDEEFDQRVRGVVERRQRFESGVIEEHPTDSQNNGFVEETLDDFTVYSNPSWYAETIESSSTSPQLNALENEDFQNLLNSQ